MRFSQEHQEWEIGSDEGCSSDNYAEFFHDHYIQIAAVDSKANPLGDIDITFSLQLAENSYSGKAVLFLYDDKNRNGVIDAGDPVVSSSNGVLVKRTDSHTGTTYVLVRAVLSCTYRGSLNAYAGHTTSSVEFNVTLKDD